MFVKITSGREGIGASVTTESGEPVEGLTSIVFRADVDNINRAELHLYVGEFEAMAKAQVMVRGKEVRRIEYADGTVDEFPA